MSLFEEKISSMYYRNWTRKDGGQLHPNKEGFTFTSSRADRKANHGRPEEGVTDEAMRKWIIQHVKPERATLERLVSFVNEFLATPKPLELRHFDDSVPLKEFCRVIGYTDQDAENAAHRRRFEEFGPQWDYTLTDADEAKQLFAVLRGLYFAFRREPPDYGGQITRMGIVVGACIPVSTRRFSILCRLSIPSRMPGECHNYTGLVSYDSRLMSWNFRQEARVYRDVAFLMTDWGNQARTDVQRDGCMMTMAQDLSSQIIYDIKIRRVSKVFSYDDVDSFLSEAAQWDFPCDADDIELQHLGGRFPSKGNWGVDFVSVVKTHGPDPIGTGKPRDRRVATSKA